MTNIDEDVLDRLEAEAKVADAEAEELTLAVESDIEQKDSEIDELQEQVDEKESEVEELEQEIDEKEEEIEEMSEKIDLMAEQYAEELAQHSDIMDADEFIERYEFEELQEKVDQLDTESTASPAPNSGDAGAGFQSPNEDEFGQEPEEEIGDVEELAASSFEQRANRTGKDYWADIAEDIKNEGE